MRPLKTILLVGTAFLAARSLYAIHKTNAGPENPEIKFNLPPPSPLTPEQELKTFKLPPGFKIELVAAEPLVEAPIAISWDDQGRLYVVEMRGYMNDMEAVGADQPVGRIKRLESTKGDGVYDKATVFVDKLVMPRAVMALGDGALVGEPPNLTFYHDTKSTGVADKSEIVTDRFGARGSQPEHMANGPTWMMDNWIYCTAHGFRYRWREGKFVIETAFGAGQWGLTQDDWGRPFFNYNSDLLRGNMVAAPLYARNPNLTTRTGLNAVVMKDQTVWPSHPTPGTNRGYTATELRADGTLSKTTATCGASIYRGNLFPKEFRGNAFVPEPAGNLVKRLILDETDGVVTARNAYTGSDFLTSTDERFRPVNTYTGPDGALYVVDMARGIIEDKAFITYYLAANIKARKLEQPLNLGRIWRIVPVGAKPKLVKLPHDTAAIVPFLAHANGWVRDTAQRVLVERADKSVAPAIEKIAANGAIPQARVQALWTLDGIGALTPEVVAPRLQDKDPKVRETAIRLADRTLMDNLLKLAKDPNPEVRLHLALRLSPESGLEVEQALIGLLKQGGSPLLGEALATGLHGRELDFIETALKQPTGKDNPIDKSGIFPILAGCVMAEHKPGRVAHLIDIVASLPPNSPRALVLLEAMVPKVKSKNAPPPKLIYLDHEPAALAQLQTGADAKAKQLADKLDKVLAWPGKPGVPPPPKIIPLTPPQQALFEKGKNLYANICAACHQPSGAGLDGLAPPLLDSDWALGAPDRPIRIVLQGVSGPLPVAGRTWQLEMPPLAVLGDEDIASVLTYIRREWEHNSSPVSPADVAKVRAAVKDRTTPWTAEELKPAEKKAAQTK